MRTPAAIYPRIERRLYRPEYKTLWKLTLNRGGTAFVQAGSAADAREKGESCGLAVEGVAPAVARLLTRRRLTFDRGDMQT